ncbi:hypothetical protein OK348_04120 [Flavobacterium sp. MXW15]|uniref:Folate-binding protein n=1 Tax=Xanthomonas chitinilytica TaxID=2989819 RepID=A0ABT3JZF5_9XANT|nr:folate-binding protein [Xanthomonas sp. H13-6]MCW4453975.1 hypothetical protein [Flavobacterium sp. MXW15]MCW4473858.1 folate-binding protein [Xanthomonas sp. H13-6]
MPDNLPPVFAGFSRLPQSQLVALSGPDALAFAQAQFASDVLALADGHWQWSAWLTAKGRVTAVFQLLRIDDGQLLLVLNDGQADDFAAQLQRFVFRRKLSIGRRDDLAVAGSFTAPELATGAALAQLADGALELDAGGNEALPRTLRLAPATALADASDADIALAWRQSDLRYGLPRLDPSQREQWTPQQLGLDRLAAYSVKKGCYPGQEIVARTHFLGKAKRSLQLLQIAEGAEAGGEVRQGDAVIGTLASVAGNLALAVLPLEIPAGPLQVGGAEATPLPLLDGLAR